MKLRLSSRLAGSLLLVGTLALSGGCGLKTDPVPPQTVVPKAIEDLRYSLDNKGATLAWTYPMETISGKDIKEIMSFELFRAEIPLKDFCSGCPIPFGEPMELPGGVIDQEQRSVGEHVSGMLRSGHKYFFKMRSRTSWLAASADSNIITFVYHTPAAAPKDVQASSGDKQVSLDWPAVSTLVDGSTADLALSYQVLKSADGRQFAPASPLLPDTSFVDTAVESGKVYYYKVQSSMTFEGETIDGSASEAVRISVTDVTPPPQVTGVTVIASASNVRIFWDAVKTDDLAGYRVYRRTAGEGEMTRIGEVGATATIFIDNDAPADAKVYYSVTAVDVDGNEGEKSQQTTTRH